MSRTRILCEVCALPQAFCTCDPKASSGNELTEKANSSEDQQPSSDKAPELVSSGNSGIKIKIGKVGKLSPPDFSEIDVTEHLTHAHKRAQHLGFGTLMLEAADTIAGLRSQLNTYGSGNSELLDVEKVLADECSKMAEEYKDHGDKWPRDWMKRHVEDRETLIKARSILLDRMALTHTDKEE